MHRVIYTFTLDALTRKEISSNIDFRGSFTHTLSPGIPVPYRKGNIALLFVRYDRQKGEIAPGTYLENAGVILEPRGEKVATVGRRVKVELVRSVGGRFRVETLCARLPSDLAERFREAIKRDVCPMSEEDGQSVLEMLEGGSGYLEALLDFLRDALDRDQLDESDPADRIYLEERDAARVATRIGGFPSSSLEVWKRPGETGAPYLAGLIREPVEQSLIDQDTRPTQEWATGVPGGRRHDITVLSDGNRRLEIANVNATPVESRLGTDLIYYHHNTQSFVFVQYKRIPTAEKHIWVDHRLYEQLDKLDNIAKMSSAPVIPEDWCLGSDPCFLKLAQWDPHEESFSMSPGRGLYLPVSYVRLLMKDSRTRGPRGGVRLGYDTVPRYLANTDFIELVKSGLVGTVGTTVQDLDQLVTGRVEEGYGAVVAMETGDETAAQRQARNRSRGGKRKRSASPAGGTLPLF